MLSTIRSICCCSLGLLICSMFQPLSSATGLERIVVQQDGQQREVFGEVLVEAADGGLLLHDPAGVFWAVTRDELLERAADDQPYKPLTSQQMATQLLSELPPGFQIHTTAHYVLAFNTSRAYAEWCGALLERLHKAFTTYWERRGLVLREPLTPLPALIFADRDRYAEYARAELGDAVSSIIGYYSLRTNRVIMYDLTGADSLRSPAGSSAAHINRVLSRPEAERTVATIIHEATHQIAFNCGLQTRYADIPLWVSEGIAIYFETPDLRSSRGWTQIGAVNQVRLADFRRGQATRTANALVDLIRSDEPFRNTRTAPQAYAEAWAWNYFLIRQKPREYEAYLKMLSAKKPLIYDEPAERLAQFQAAFGDDLQQLDREFLRYMQKVR